MFLKFNYFEWILGYQNDPKKNEDYYKYLQIFINIGPLFSCAHVGAMMGFSGIILPQLENGDDKIGPITYRTASWIASSAVLPLTFASLIGGYLMERKGRMWVHCLACVPGMMGWIIIAFSSNVQMIIIGRILNGICGGLTGPATSIYIAETTEPSLRPFVLGGIALNLTLGTLICHLMGTFFSWEITALVCTAFPLFGLVFSLLAPETPHFLLGKGKIDEATKTFQSIRGEDDDSIKELNILLNKEKNIDFTCRLFFTRPEIYKPLMILIAYFVCAQLSAMNVVNFYVISIVENSLGKDVNSYAVMLSMDAVRVVTSCIACILMKNLKRRTLILSGGSGVFLCLITLAISTYLSQYIKGISLIPLLALIAYVFFISISLVPLPWCLAGEILPAEAKGLASGILCFISFWAFFAVIKTAPDLFVNEGTAFTFLIYSFFAFLGTILCYFYMPETKNKTLNDIAMIYTKKTEESIKA